MNAKKISAIFSITVLLTGLFIASAPVYAASASKKIKVTSSAFKNGGNMAAKYAFADPSIPGSENKSPPLTWKVSKKTAKKIKSFAITIIDLHPVAEKCVHLAAINIPANTRAIEEGAFSGFASLPEGTQSLVNCFGSLGYGGPFPPEGTGDHVYDITVYGLKVADIGLSKDDAMHKEFKADALQKLFKGKTVAKGKLKGKFRIDAGTMNDADGASGPMTKMVSITSAGFNPLSLTINAGDTVVFQNNDSGVHWPASAVHPSHTAYPETGGCIGSKFDACTGLAQSETFSFTFNQKGTWHYHDHLNSSLQGTITVE
ncbi:YbhB/YbcL family Raf kinase inhibitor-like protein [Candidatus Peregrinibacteria bacterium]|nr:YbhB/YbcL family Raf kinase inhibitor-like protein [Candidatus Peregrinibacteria bacterium]